MTDKECPNCCSNYREDGGCLCPPPLNPLAEWPVPSEALQEAASRYTASATPSGTRKSILAMMQDALDARESVMLPTDSAARKALPLCRGVLDYFPAALAAVAELSLVGNEKHNPGQDLHHARSKSSDHADCVLRHLADRGEFFEEEANGKTYRIRHSAAVAWRALALLQEELEAAGAPLARGARAN